jgi:hypothetical protein
MHIAPLLRSRLGRIDLESPMPIKADHLHLFLPGAMKCLNSNFELLGLILPYWNLPFWIAWQGMGTIWISILCMLLEAVVQLFLLS